MHPTRYRRSVEDFISATEWEVSSPRARANMQRALEYFNRHVPATELDHPDPPRHPGPQAFRPDGVTWTRLMGWMQAINFEYPVQPESLVTSGDALLAFRAGRVNRGNHRYGNFYVRNPDGNRAGRHHSPAVSAIPGGVGIPTTQHTPVRYTARKEFTCLETTAGDAFLSWIDPDLYESSYAPGGSRQLFIWQADRLLKPNIG